MINLGIIIEEPGCTNWMSNVIIVKQNNLRVY